MNPSDYGFPPHVKSFRDAQTEAAEFAITSEKRFVVLSMPPGSGKSGAALLIQRLLGQRAVTITANLGLENQYLETLPGNYTSIRGRNNYPCWEGGTCREGLIMGCADNEGCPYACAKRAADIADRPLTNMAYWLKVNSMGPGMVKPEVLIVDEAHLAFEWLSRALDFHISEAEYKRAGGEVSDIPHTEDMDTWMAMSDYLIDQISAVWHRLKARISVRYGIEKEKNVRKFKEVDELLERLQKLKMLNDNWVITMELGTDKGRVWRFECVWPGMYKESLFQWIPKVILLSATICRKTTAYLGIAKADYEFKEWPRQFAAEHGPVVHIPTCNVRQSMTEDDTRTWLNRHREIAYWGRDRNGICHTVAYWRVNQIKDAVSSVVRCIVNGSADPDAKSATEAYEDFLRADYGTLLVSPSFSTGWDFKYRIAEYQIISKIAYPYMGSKVVKARMESDRDYSDYVAVQDLVQASGRIVRDFDDLGTTIIIDDNVERLMRRGKDYAPRWFKVRTVSSLPEPLPKL